MIKIKNLYLNYIKEYSALNNINLTVENNEKVALVGDLDSGKTSLIRCICGLEKFNKGDIYLNDIHISKINFKSDINIIYLSSKPAFFNNKSVYQNLAYPLKLRNFPEELINQKINRALDNLGIEGLKEKKIKHLTNNEKQIVNIARSILRDADIYLIDDIFTFDEQTNEKIAKVLVENFNPSASMVFALNNNNTNLAKTLQITKIVKLNYGSIVE